MAPAPERQLTVRAIITGFVLGAVLAPCNIYTGLKIGFSFNMSIAAALLSYAWWNSLHHFGAAKHWGLLENNINQTAASSAASILSAGLVAPIPALALLTDYKFTYPVLTLWVFTVSFVGIACALAVRRQMLDREALPFPNGVATAETITEIYSHGKEAAARVKMLLGAGLLSGGIFLFNAFVYKIPSLGLPASWGFKAPANVAAKGLDRVSWRALGMEIQPSLLLLGFGAIVGPRVGISLLLGTIIAWMLLPGPLLAHGWAQPALDGASWYTVMLEWLLWPGVSLMVAGALTSFALSMVKIFKSKLSGNKGVGSDPEASEADEIANAPGGVRYFPKKWFVLMLAVGFVGCVIAQQWIFSIPLWLGTIAFGLSFLLAVVAARVSGETGIPPIGALGKITQVTFGFLTPTTNPASFMTANLMAANVTGGAAGQCSDMLHDLKTGKLIGASLRGQVVAQIFGILAGSLAGCAAYMILIPNPQEMLLTEKWPAPAVATWKAVAEVLAEGLDTIPHGCGPAVVVAIVIGVVLACLEALLPQQRRHWVPSASSLGFAFIIPPFISLGIFVGAMLRVVAERLWKHWSAKYLIVLAAGLVAGESLAGVVQAIVSFFQP
ncbi:OPT family oligopeptide transporter [Ruficoccus sp. ZRK36]|uniref:OPT family oligopeptide transporter n=1 Tax=Ruficoccus sp. ZRK36 TaxID=2866311 RepID=UPI001C7300B7|nr:OPT family oligopeptide transporter [Ruficoccus sp. ZRK36]QYY34841.1 OPT/YSL family transporter [Ruficoccus sp. ZRK36]